MEKLEVASENRDAKSKLISNYKAILKRVIDHRPAGLRRRLATSLGKHKSFISQITNPIYRVPIPAHDLQTIFDVCMLSVKEKKAFLDLYNQAHGTHIDIASTPDRMMTDVIISMPAFNDARLAKEAEDSIRDFAAKIIALAKSKDTEPLNGSYA